MNSIVKSDTLNIERKIVTEVKNDTITVEEFIASRSKDDVTYYNYSILEYLNGFEMFITNILYDYEDEFNDEIVTVELKDTEQIKYRYKPELFAYDISGSTGFSFIIMMLNGIIDPKEFNFKKIKVIKSSILKTLLNRIKIINSEFMNNNISKRNDAFKENIGNTIWNE